MIDVNEENEIFQTPYYLSWKSK